MQFRLDDYIDADVAYLVGLVIGRGAVSEVSGIRQLTISFSYSSLRTEGINTSLPLDTAVRLGLDDIRERISPSYSAIAEWRSLSMHFLSPHAA
jgi:hypothetical protein